MPSQVVSHEEKIVYYCLFSLQKSVITLCLGGCLNEVSLYYFVFISFGIILQTCYCNYGNHVAHLIHDFKVEKLYARTITSMFMKGFKVQLSWEE